ncbi:NAD(P)-dependent oxidoreductase [Tsuneonella sp. HG222]
MKVALIGATGPVGRRILAELVERGHEVTAIVRNVENVPVAPNVHPVPGDVADEAGLSVALAGHEAVISSVRFLKTSPQGLIGTIRASGVKRYICVGGAASLYVPGTQTKLLDAGAIPEQYLPEPTAGARFLDVLKQVEDLDWTFLSPPMMFANDEQFGTKPGYRTGTFRLGKDELLVGESGESEISYEDYAVALVDELEAGAHIRQRFTVGY